jgi:prepilin peptidase CpaA
MAPFWQFGLIGILAVALTTDLQNRKIYNWLTFPAMLIGLALNVGFGGLHGLQSSMVGFFVGSLVFVLGYMMNSGNMGAGDVKLMAAIGLWLGWPYTFAAVLYVALFGGIIAILTVLFFGDIVQLCKNMWWILVGLVVPGGKKVIAIEKSAAPPDPYGVSIALGTALALFCPEPSYLFNTLLHRPMI